MNKEELMQELKNLKGGQWTEKSADAIAAVLDEYIDNQGPLSYNNVSEDLEKAAEEYANSDDFNDKALLIGYDEGDLAKCFKAGANWQKEQMMKDAVEKRVFYNFGMKRIELYENELKGLEFGDKVKLIIIKGK